MANTIKIANSRIRIMMAILLRRCARIITKCTYLVNTRWAWFFTNGNKEPKAVNQLIFPEDYK